MTLDCSPNGMWAHWSSSLIRPVALRRDTPTLTSRSKKTRVSASLPRFGMSLRLRFALWYHGTTVNRVGHVRAQQSWGQNPIACYGGDRFGTDSVLTFLDTPTAIPIKRAAIVFGTSSACFVGSLYGKRSKSAVVY
jgi:hypothetical protein